MMAQNVLSILMSLILSVSVACIGWLLVPLVDKPHENAIKNLEFGRSACQDMCALKQSQGISTIAGTDQYSNSTSSLSFHTVPLHSHSILSLCTPIPC